MQAVPEPPALPSCRSKNPADWMLDVSSPSAEAELGVDFADSYQLSELCEANDTLIDTFAVPKEGDQDLQLAELAAASGLVQVGALGWGHGLGTQGRVHLSGVPRKLRCLADSGCWGEGDFGGGIA